jgi:hypothetical protein
MAHDDGTHIRAQLARAVDSPPVHHYGSRLPGYVVASLEAIDPDGYGRCISESA